MRYHGSRYFDGYERAPSGKLVYTGPRYGFPTPEATRRMKGLTAILTIGMLAVEFLAQFFPSAGGMQRYMAIPCLGSLVPLIFWIMGQVEFLMAKSSWELRVYYSGFRRLYRAAICQTVICCVWLAGEVWYLIGHFGDFGSEIRYFLCVLLCAGISGGMTWLLHRNPAQVVEGPTVR